MSVAVIGAGFVGLAAAYHLSAHYTVTLIDRKGVGGGASGVSSGLMHPYPGEKGRRSWEADLALRHSLALMDHVEAHGGRVVTLRNGIERHGSILQPGPDVQALGPNHFLILSGVTVLSQDYLNGLWSLCTARGVVMEHRDITSLDELPPYDHVVLAMGYGIRAMPQAYTLPLGYVKGHILTCALPHPLVRSISSKRYTAVTHDPLQCHIGSTYERTFTDEAPDMEKAVTLLKPSYTPVQCRAAVRVTHRAHYFPIIEQLAPRTWVLTAFGSRGLLYHALMASRLTQAILAS